MLYLYGIHTHLKQLGHYGNPEECPVCHKIAPKTLYKCGRYIHIDYVPICPLPSNYLIGCPICMHGKDLKKAEAKPMLSALNINPVIQVYAKHISAAQNPKRSYELWAHNAITNEEICIQANLTKNDIKKARKNRGLTILNTIEQ